MFTIDYGKFKGVQYKINQLKLSDDGNNILFDYDLISEMSFNEKKEFEEWFIPHITNWVNNKITKERMDKIIGGSTES